MPRRLPLYVERNCVRGRTYLSFRRGKGPRIRLPDNPTSDEFRTAYEAALIGAPAKPAGREAVGPGTLAALIISYRQSREFVGLRATTKAGYISRLDAIRRAHGHRAVGGLTRERIVTGILQPYADRPGAAADTLKKLRILIRHAIDLGWLRHDPSLGIKRPKNQRIRSWTEPEIAAFRTRWPVGSKQRLAFELFLNTGQRRSDVVRMAWPQVANGRITLTQQKTGRRLVIPLHRDLIAILANAEREHVSILVTAYGKPFTVDGFSQWMRDAIRGAGLPLECQPHGLRKATGRRLAEAGATAKEIMAILGHVTLAEAERYTEDADQIGLAEGAMVRLEAHRANRTAQTGPESLGKSRKTKQKQ